MSDFKGPLANLFVPVDDSGRVVSAGPRTTTFDETVTAQRLASFYLAPTWGSSVLREQVTTTGTGAAVTETSGELVLATGTAADNVVQVRTRQRGQYRSGLTGEVGIGVRVPDAPTGTQVVTWGYFDDNNGFGFGRDVTGWFVFARTGGVDTKVYQSAWNQDAADGTGASGVTLGTSAIFQIEFVWYGYGTIRWYVNLAPDTTGVSRRVEVHRTNPTNALSVVDPNQPITIRAVNGASSDTSLAVYLGGRQFSQIGGNFPTETRPVAEYISRYAIAAALNTWEPLIALRRAVTFGPSNRANSVRINVRGFDAISDNATQWRVTTNAVTDGGTYAAPTDWSGESACQTKVQAGSLTVTTAGFPVMYGLTDGSRVSTASVAAADEFFLGNTEVVLWARKTTSTTPTVSATLRWSERW